MASDSPAIVARETVYRGWTSMERVALRLPGPVEVERHIEDHGIAACVLPYDPERRVALLVSMPRAPVIDAGEADLLEAPAGRVGDEGPAECAIREALEETGVALKALEPLVVGWSMPGISTERVHFFLAAYSAADRIEAGGGAEDEHENITVHELPLSDLWARAERGALSDTKTLLLLYALRARRPELWAV